MTKIRNQQQVIDAAAKVFAEKGYDAARLEDIAAELGVLQGSLYYHIGSKAGLLRLVRVRRFQAITAAIAEIADGPGTPSEKLEHAVHTHLRYIVEHLSESSNWFRRLHDPRRTVGEVAEDEQLTAQYRGCWKSILRQGVEDGSFRSDLELGVAVLSLLGVLNWTSAWYDPKGRFDIDEIATTQHALIQRGLLPA